MPASLLSLGNIHDRIVIEQDELTRKMQEQTQGREAERACCALIHNDHYLSDARASENRLDKIEFLIVTLSYELAMQKTISVMLRCYAQRCNMAMHELSLSHIPAVDVYVKEMMTEFMKFVKAICINLNKKYHLRKIPATHRVILEARAAIQGIEAESALELLRNDATLDF